MKFVTRFVEEECPACGKRGKPVEKSPVKRSFAELIPGVDIYKDTKRVLTRTFHCPHCDHAYTTPLKERAQSALDQIREIAKGKPPLT